MLTLEYIVIIAGVFFSLTFLWLGALDCLVSSPVKSAAHCLTLIIGQSEQVLTESRAKLRNKQRNPNHTTQAQSSVSTQLVPYTV